jgi:hypothetical protein
METVAFSSVTPKRGRASRRSSSPASLAAPRMIRCLTGIARRGSSSSGSMRATVEPECSTM